MCHKSDLCGVLRNLNSLVKKTSSQLNGTTASMVSRLTGDIFERRFPRRGSSVVKPSIASANIAIIGAGFAGLTCAYRLAVAGLHPQVFEASGRVGGRVRSIRNHFPNNQVAEIGGELIDSHHVSLRGMAEELGLELTSLRPEDKEDNRHVLGTEELPEDWLSAEFQPLRKAMVEARDRALRDPIYFQDLDNCSISEWLESQAYVDRNLLKFLEEAYVGQFGVEAHNQSVFNLLNILDNEDANFFRVYGDSDERYVIRGGNDQIATRLQSYLPRPIEFRSELLAVREAGASVILSFSREGRIFEKSFDVVVFALPFSTLRNVDLQKSGLSSRKRQIIDSLGYGKSSKILAGFSSRPWQKQTDDLSVISERPLHMIWEGTRGQSGESGVLSNVLLKKPFQSCSGQKASEQFRDSLESLERLYPGVKASFIPELTIAEYWGETPWALGNYSCFRPGQAQFSGDEGKSEKSYYFCGEHCAIKTQGFMEGAVETGNAVARQIVHRIFAHPG